MYTDNTLSCLQSSFESLCIAPPQFIHVIEGGLDRFSVHMFLTIVSLMFEYATCKGQKFELA